jgi:pimeloyl-ACP methyl ester carboxylesterase
MNARLLRRSATAVAVSIIAGAGVVVPPAATAVSTTLAWTDCGDAGLSEGGFECARLIVPMDRRHPGAGTFSLPLIRHRSTGTPDQRIGSLVFNPGGPGGSGIASMGFIWGLLLPDEVKQRFDLVSWDPRGVGASVPALEDCATPWPARPATGPVDWTRVTAGFDATLSAANAECQKKNAGFIEHMGTVENVQDLDRIRAALGEDALTYWGMSYGTRIGYVYTMTFPTRVRAIVLDGSIDPADTTLGLSEGGAAPDQAFGAWANAYPVSAAQLAAVVSVLNRRTVRLVDGTRLTRWLVKDMFYGSVAQQLSYPDLAAVANVLYALLFGTAEQQAQAAPGAALIAAAQRTQPNTNAGGVFSVVNCLDYADRPTLAQSTQAVFQQLRNAPAYGGSLTTAYALTCSGLTMKPDPVPVITGDGPRVPVLVLGASRDGSTIQTWTGRMSRALPLSRTVTYAGGQHVTWGFASSDCVDAVANAYVTSLTLPDMDVGCPNTVAPQQ